MCVSLKREQKKKVKFAVSKAKSKLVSTLVYSSLGNIVNYEVYISGYHKVNDNEFKS